ncbi:MAG: MOFRL family protein [Candidatus Cloacimonadaceae bacterium]|nr:MOFRL family protein [Candidatus Cloacimonadaceae bacterium]
MKIRYSIVGDNLHFRQKLAEELKRQNIRTEVYKQFLSLDVRTCSELFAQHIKSIISYPHPTVFLYGGECPVQVSGRGLGGRAMHLALMMTDVIKGIDGLWFMAAGTDGTDGPTLASGAIVHSGTMAEIHAAGLDYRSFIENCDSYRIFDNLGALLVSGPTGTNVNDIYILAFAGTEKNLLDIEHPCQFEIDNQG